MCVFLFKPPKQFSSDLLSSGYLFSSAIDASAPGDLRGVGIAGLFGSFESFCHVPVPCDILDLVHHLRIFFAQKYLFRCAGYRLSNMTDSQKNSATALFGLNIDNLAKLASTLPYSTMTITIE